VSREARASVEISPRRSSFITVNRSAPSSGIVWRIVNVQGQGRLCYNPAVRLMTIRALHFAYVVANSKRDGKKPHAWATSQPVKIEVDALPASTSTARSRKFSARVSGSQF